jgi:cell division septum initiation protein DivIVA
MPKLPEFKDWQAPWEKNGTEFSADVAKKLIYDLHRDTEKLTDEKSELKGQVGELQAKVTEAERANETEAEKSARERKELEDKLASAATKDLDITRLELALEHGLTKSQAKRLVGSTPEELQADAEELIADLGLKKDEQSTEQERETPNGHTRPRRVVNPLNPQGGDTGISADQLLEQIPLI